VVAEEAKGELRIRLRDPDDRRPPIVVSHRQARQLLLKANYLICEAIVPGRGPSVDGELAFRFRGPLRRQRPSLRWLKPVDDDGQWPRRLEASLLEAVRSIKAIEELRIAWSASEGTWHVHLRSLSGSMVGGFMSPLPIPVPMDREEAQGFIAMVDVLAATASG
jgi:hypothetical protein